MDRLRKLEDRLIEVETRVMLVLVLLMLSLAAYNVFYRNLLVPLQKHWATSGPPVMQMESVDQAEPEAARATPAADPEAEGFAGGFDGGETKAATQDEVEGFGGGFDTAGDARGGEPLPPAAESFGGGFGGGFDTGDGAPEDPDSVAAAAELEDLVAQQGAVRPDHPGGSGSPVGGPPPAGSLAAWGVKAIDAIKLGWIDIFLRQLVILVSFLGAMLATRRGKHINIDALSKVLPRHIRRAVALALNVVSVAVCIILASAGADLVNLGREFPKELLPGTEEWVFQLMFPLGFGLLTVHFVVRVVEGVHDLRQRPGARTEEAA